MILPRARPVWPAAVAVATCLGAWLLCKPHLAVFPLDDAYIHLAYVRCFAASGHFCFNPGEPSLGTSSPLFVLLLAPLYRAGLPVYGTELALSLMSFLVMVLFAIALARRAAQEAGAAPRVVNLAACLAGVLVGLNGEAHWLAFSGMETPLLLAVTLALVHAYICRGYRPLTGALAGILFLLRAPGGALAALFFGLEVVAGRGRKSIAGGVVTALFVVPFMYVAYSITGGVVPTTAKGKLLTYVTGGYDFGEMVHFVGRFAELQKYQPGNFVIWLLGLTALGVWIAQTRPGWPRIRRLFEQRSTPFVVAAWAFVHFSVYLWSFRSVGQHGRYVFEEQVAFAILGPAALARLVTAAPRFARSLTIIGVALALSCVAVLPLWRGYLARNVEHVDSTFLAMGHYIAESTPKDARIGAFDIGVARYIGDRYVIDLGGLLDPKSWSCLRQRNCGSYAREHGATHFLYSREPEADDVVGIHKSEYASPLFLKQSIIHSTQYPDYAAPTLTHSLRLELTRVDGWFPWTDEGMRAAFSIASLPPDMTPVSFDAGDGLEIVGYSLDRHDVRYLHGYPYWMTVDLAYKVHAQPTQPTWLHFGFFSEEGGHRPAETITVLASEGVMLAGHWPVGDIVRIHQYFPVPYVASGSPWRLSVAPATTQLFDPRYPQLQHWLDLGSYDAQPSVMRALAPL